MLQIVPKVVPRVTPEPWITARVQRQIARRHRRRVVRVQLLQHRVQNRREPFRQVVQLARILQNIVQTGLLQGVAGRSDLFGTVNRCVKSEVPDCCFRWK